MQQAMCLARGERCPMVAGSASRRPHARTVLETHGRLDPMASSLDNALQRALSIRLNLQISLSQMPIVEEWMDIHLDRWLEHNPMPPDMPDGEGVSYLAMPG